MKLISIVLSLLILRVAYAAQIVTDGSHAACEEFRFVKELKLFKDPTLFLSNLSVIYQDPATGWESLMHENPLLTTLRGTVHLMKLGPELEFKNFGAIARIYELAEPKLRMSESREKHAKIVPVKVCGSNEPYGDTLGFVLVSDLKSAQIEDQEGASMPPSTLPNPIPKLRKYPYWE